MEQTDFIIIDFKAIFSILLKNKWLILIITSLVTLAGIYYAINKTGEYISEGKILPEVNGSGSGGSLGGLANLVGIGGFELGLKNSTDAIRPDLYPDVISSTPFFLNLLNQRFQDKNGDSVLFLNYYHRVFEEDKKEEDVEKLVEIKAKPNGVIIVNRITEDRILELRKRVSGTIDKKSGIIIISSKMPDPVIAAEVTKYAMTYLTKYVSEYRTEKLKQEVDFLGRKVAAARGEFYKDQAKKATYEDLFSAPTIRLQSADIQRERLESEYKMSSNVYNELLKKYEEAKIKLQQETPIFQVLNPPNASNIESGPQKLSIIIFFGIAGFILGVIVAILFEKLYRKQQ